MQLQSLDMDIVLLSKLGILKFKYPSIKQTLTLERPS